MITVLVVDDDFRVARIHSAFVDRIDGFRTIGVANTGQEAIRLAVALVPDLILLDLYLPDVFGLDVLNRMRVAGVEGDAIVISAANESETVERAVKLGVVNYLLKPFTADDLRQRLTDYQANRKARHPKTLTDQAAVDQLWGRGESGRPEVLPKGLSPETAELIVQALAAAEGELRRRTNERLLRSGVTMLDPTNTFIDTTVVVGRDVTIFPGALLQGDTVIGDRTEVGPDTRLIDCRVGDDCVIESTTGRQSVVGAGAHVGPYAVLMPGSEIPGDLVTGPFYNSAGDG